MESHLEKQNRLIANLQKLPNIAVAFSSGVDSTYLLKIAKEALGPSNVVALTATSCVFPQREAEEAKEFCEREGIRQIVLQVDELKIPGFAQNPPNRCYICKKQLFSGFQKLAQSEGFCCVAEGSNMDDLGDYRPGLKAITELGIASPLREAKLYKEEIRKLSREWKLSTSEKPSFACLASRFVYGERITEERLRMVEQAEDYLLRQGFSQFRVRVHGVLARIEVLQEDLTRLFEMRSEIDAYCKQLGFTYVTMDLSGFQTGSMNKLIVNKGEYNGRL